jgi:hypothetical protein
MRWGRVLAGALLALVLAGCAGTQPGDRNPGSGYSNSVADLNVKVPALQADPCRGAQAGTLFGGCGRYVAQVANTIGALRAELAGQSGEIDTLQAAVNSYQRSGCDGGSPTTAQRTDCPRALTSIGIELDRLDQALVQLPTSR